MKLKYLSITLALAGVLAAAGCGEDAGKEAGTPAAAPGAAAARPSAPLPDNGFRATLNVANPPARLAPGETATLTVKVKNASDVAWPLGGRPGDGFFQVNLGDHWKDAEGKEVKVDERIAMPHAVGPGEEVERLLVVKAPDKPGDYVLELDVVQEGVAWFSQKGSQPLKLNVKVGR
jgi:hypothetical protein